MQAPDVLRGSECLPDILSAGASRQRRLRQGGPGSLAEVWPQRQGKLSGKGPGDFQRLVVSALPDPGGVKRYRQQDIWQGNV